MKNRITMGSTVSLSCLTVERYPGFSTSFPGRYLNSLHASSAAKRFACCPFALGNLILMVRENKVLPSAMNIQSLPGNAWTWLNIQYAIRPSPAPGLSQEGSPGFSFFQRAKSMGCFFLSSISTLAPDIISSRFCPESLP